jgi:putative membrane protein
MDLSMLPPLNAALNSVAAVLLVVGRSLARQGRLEAHKAVMLSAFGVSSVFLASYVTHKVWRDFENTTLNVVGLAKTAYLALLASHVLLAATVPVIAISLIVLGLRDKRETHRRVARIGWPIWMYVSVTGVVIYVLLYHLNPPPI